MHQAMEVAENPFEPGDNSFKIVSVCRISDHAKGVFRMLNICERLVRSEVQLKWYLVGDGPDLPALREEVRKRNLEEVFLTPGKKDNPFAYYIHADLVTVFSYYEGLCGVVNEAKVAGAAVAATKFSGINEQITPEVNGVIL
jgi:glycosyltransferase involved in cell wall biosynthesis